MITEGRLPDHFAAALIDLLRLDYDMLAAYDVALQKLANPIYISSLKQFKEDHYRHILQINNLLLDHGIEPPSGPDFKQYVTKGRIYVSTLFGDDGIIAAMNSNENEANAAYQYINQYVDRWPEAVAILRHGLEDETVHRLWVKSIMEDENLKIRLI